VGVPIIILRTVEGLNRRNMTEQLDQKHIAIIDRAASRLRKENREPFKKFVADVLRGQREPTNTTVRHACASAFIKFGRRT
jgi:hypothetical protein